MRVVQTAKPAGLGVVARGAPAPRGWPKKGQGDAGVRLREPAGLVAPARVAGQEAAAEPDHGPPPRHGRRRDGRRQDRLVPIHRPLPPAAGAHR